jgi:hypothetical protein
MAPLGIILAMSPQRHRRQVPPRQPREFHAVRGRHSISTAIFVIILRRRDGARRRILRTAASGIAGREERACQPRYLVNGVILKPNDKIVAAAATVPPGRRRQVVPELVGGGWRTPDPRRWVSGPCRRASRRQRRRRRRRRSRPRGLDPSRHRDRRHIDRIRSPRIRRRSRRLCRDRLVSSSRDGPFRCPRRHRAARRRSRRRGPFVAPTAAAVVSSPPSSSLPHRPNSPRPVSTTWRPNW